MIPGSDFVNKQTALGGAAGIALLLFALAYRFYPELPGRQSEQTAPGTVAETGSSPLVTQLQGRSKVDDALSAVREEAVRWGPPISLAPPPPPPPKAVAALLKKADEALAKGRLLDASDGALALYRKVLDAHTRNIAARAGVDKVREAIRKQFDTALDAGNEDEAARLIQLLHEQSLDDGHLADMDDRLKRLHETRPLLERAAELLHGTAKDSTDLAKNRDAALSLYRQVIKLDADNRLADQGLADIERVWLDRARAAAAQDDFAAADDALRDAAAIRPGSQALLDARSQIQAIRHQRAAATMAQADSALDAGNADLAQSLAQRALGLSPDLAGLDAFNERLRNLRLYAGYTAGQAIDDVFVDRKGKAPSLIVIPTGRFA
ncbi:MAG: formylglycine-generating enzyme family protein, partial [Proteobacteria bacterium]|nr:formylglycine-generating enzyme family protein [Pseudomonadota bacterium]